MTDKTEDFVQKAKKVHGEKYDYSFVNYVTAKTKIKIVCHTHGIWLQTPNGHLCGYGCPRCNGHFIKGSQEQKDYQISKAKAVHGEKYDYSQVNFDNLFGKSQNQKISCSIHGVFEQSWIAHVTNKSGCPKCALQSKSIKRRAKLEDFINNAITVHGNKYDYSQVNYQGAHKKVSIICSTHGVFECTPANHWSNKVGCQKCVYANASRGELFIANWLTENNIKFETQKSYPDLFWKSSNGRLKYDFWLPDNNMLIEYDGEHHTLPISWDKNIDGTKRLAEQIERDKIKTNYAKLKNIQLIRISYKDDIHKILSAIFVSSFNLIN